MAERLEYPIKRERNLRPEEINLDRGGGDRGRETVAQQPISGKGGTVVLIAGVLFVGYLYLSRRLVAVYRAVRYGADMIPAAATTGTSPYMGPTVPAPGSPAPPTGGFLPSAFVPWKNHPERPPERVYFLNERGCRTQVYAALLRHGYTPQEALTVVEQSCQAPPSFNPSLPGLMLP